MPYIRYNHWIPKLLKVQGITLVPFILFSCSKSNVQEFMIKHELTHITQIKRDGWFKFYWKYLSEYHALRKGGLSQDQAYRLISYEVEAYANQNQPLNGDEQKYLA